MNDKQITEESSIEVWVTFHMSLKIVDTMVKKWADTVIWYRRKYTEKIADGNERKQVVATQWRYDELKKGNNQRDQKIGRKEGKLLKKNEKTNDKLVKENRRKDE